MARDRPIQRSVQQWCHSMPVEKRDLGVSGLITGDAQAIPSGRMPYLENSCSDRSFFLPDEEDPSILLSAPPDRRYF